MAGKTPRELVEYFQKNFMEFHKDYKAEANAFSKFIGTFDKPNALDEKQKELISIGISLAIRCEYCVAIHVQSAYKAGASKEEILDAGLVAVTMGGGPVMTYFVTLLKECAQEFENDFK